MPSSQLVVLGRLAKPHGVNGELRVDYYAESPGLLERPLMIRAGNRTPRPVHVREWHLWRDQLILSIEGCADRSTAEQLRGQELLIDESFLPEAEDDEPYLRDLIGLRVLLASGEEVGILEDVDAPSGQELWTIRAPDGDGGREILLPAVPEFVSSIDLEQGTAVITPPDGLLDLYLGSEPAVQDDGLDEPAGHAADRR